MITERQKEFAKALCGLAASFGINNLEGKFRCSFIVPDKPNDYDSRDEVTFHWDSGRHGADADKIHLNCIERINIAVGGPQV
jgi:hypothetical protein